MGGRSTEFGSSIPSKPAGETPTDARSRPDLPLVSPGSLQIPTEFGLDASGGRMARPRARTET